MDWHATEWIKNERYMALRDRVDGRLRPSSFRLSDRVASMLKLLVQVADGSQAVYVDAGIISEIANTLSLLKPEVRDALLRAFDEGGELPHDLPTGDDAFRPGTRQNLYFARRLDDEE